MIAVAKVLRLDRNVEEEIDVDIGGARFTAFAAICPFRVFEGRCYEVSLELTVLDEPRAKVLKESAARIQRIGSTFAHRLSGRLEPAGLRIGTLLLADEMLSEFAHLQGAFFEVEVDRMTLEFRREVSCP